MTIGKENPTYRKLAPKEETKQRGKTSTKNYNSANLPEINKNLKLHMNTASVKILAYNGQHKDAEK